MVSTGEEAYDTTRFHCGQPGGELDRIPVRQSPIHDPAAWRCHVERASSTMAAWLADAVERSGAMDHFNVLPMTRLCGNHVSRTTPRKLILPSSWQEMRGSQKGHSRMTTAAHPAIPAGRWCALFSNIVSYVTCACRAAGVTGRSHIPAAAHGLAKEVD